MTTTTTSRKNTSWVAPVAITLGALAAFGLGYVTSPDQTPQECIDALNTADSNIEVMADFTDLMIGFFEYGNLPQSSQIDALTERLETDAYLAQRDACLGEDS